MKNENIRQIMPNTNNSNNDVRYSLRYNSGKVDWRLVNFQALEPLARVLEYGATKYDKDNWKKPPSEDTEHLASMCRHLFALMAGEEFDPESGLHHMGHIMANAMIYSYHHNNCEKIEDNNNDK